jgi:hypothetical protein
MFPNFGPVPASLADGAGPDPQVAALVANLRDLDEVATREKKQVEALAGLIPGVPVVRVPYLSGDVHDIAGLNEVGDWLFERP